MWTIRERGKKLKIGFKLRVVRLLEELNNLFYVLIQNIKFSKYRLEDANLVKRKSVYNNTYYNRDGKIYSIKQYQDSECISDFLPYTEILFHENGMVRSVKSYKIDYIDDFKKDILLFNYEQRFYSTGQLEYSSFRIKGKLWGKEIFYDQHGQIEKVRHYDFGKLEKENTIFNEFINKFLTL